uniref:Integrase catalytic domain-containing protein n=1 Tax=Fagus sylvatica TaxID=28930 RepID=A0A2N9ID84_FAGSY
MSIPGPKGTQGVAPTAQTREEATLLMLTRLEECGLVEGSQFRDLDVISSTENPCLSYSDQSFEINTSKRKARAQEPCLLNPDKRRKQREVSARVEHSQAESAVNVQGQDQPQPPPSNHNQEVPPTNLLLELIQSLQQNQSELAEAIKQLKEKDAGTKTPPQNEGKPPYPAELLKQPYPEKYIAPTFSRFDGRKGSALVHISKFVDSMGAYAGNGDLCLREFSKSLDDRAYTWYTTLPPGSVKVWEDMVELFCGKYFQAEEKITLVNLHTTKQANGEDLLRYIHRFRDISLDCYANYEEGELVGLLQKARKTALSVKPHTEKPREKKNPPQVLTVSTVNNKRKKSNERSFDEAPPPVPCTLEEMKAILDKWVADGIIKLPEAQKKATEEDKKNPKFCYFHRYVHHSTADCWTLRRKFHEKIQDGTLELPQVQQKVHTDPFLKHKNGAVVSVVIHGSTSDVDADESATASTAMTPTAIKTLQRNPRFRSLFNQLGLNPEARTAATEAIMAIAADSGAHCFTAETHASRAFLETTNATTINEVQVRRALVDNGSCINLIPLSTIQAAEIPQKKIQGAPMEIKGFGGVGLGCTNTNSSPPPTTNVLKGRLNGKPIRIAANSAPFDQSESHFVEAALYDEITPAGEASLAKPVGIPLPKWEEIRDAPGADLRDMLEQKKKRKAEASTSKSQPQCPSCLAVNEASAPEPADAAEPVAADSKISAEEELEVINLSSDPDVNRPVSISASLSVEERMHLVELLKEYQDVFAWQYDEMPGIDPKLVAHSLNVEPGTRPVVQPMRTFHPEVEAQITQEVKKLLSAGFIKPIQHPRMKFPLPNMDLLIDSAAGHAMFSFMDGFSGYNQIFMSPKDAEKTAFRTPIGNFYYTVMPFGLKNAGATYQRTMTAMFHDMMHREIEDYVDDIVVKSKTRGDHFGVLKKVFERCRLYKLKMNPLKCAFGVSAGKFLGFLVHQRGIDVDPTRASAIATMKPPTTHKELKSFLGKLSYIRRFIPGLAAVTSAFSPLLKKGASFHWSTECQEAFEKVQNIMTKLPTVCAPISGKPLRLYLASNSQAIGALIAQENDNGVEQPIYYVSRTLKDAESRYSGAERSCLALIYASQRLRHYFLAHKISTMASAAVTMKYPGKINEVFLAGLADSVWTLRFDGSSTATSAGAGIVLYKDDGEAVTKSFKFDFPCSNNAAEYEAYLAGLAIAYEMGIKHLRVIGDSNLVVCQARGEFSLKEPSLAPYRALAQKFEARFSTFEIEHAQRNENRLPGGVLARCISLEEAKERLPKIHETTCGDGGAVSLYRRLQRLGYFWPSMSAEAAEIQNQCPTCQFHYSNEEVCATFVSTDWRTPFLEYLLERILPSNPKDAYRLKRLALRKPHAGECGEHQGKKRLYQCLLTLGYYWPTMKKDAADFVKTCHTCQVQANLIHTHPTSLQNMATPWPFHTWGLDLIGPINPASGGCIWILVATEYFTKWVEAIPLRKATGAAVANFIREHIITRFGIPYKLITDNGTPFINKDVREVLEHYRVKHRRSTPYYPQDVLWAYRSSPKTATGFTPFSLVYGTDTISPTELVVPSPRVMQGSELETDANMCAEARMADLEGLDEARDLAKAKAQRNYQKMASVYSKALRVRIFAEGQMVLKAAEFVRRNLPPPSKFSPNWDGPYIIREAHGSGYYRLSKSDGTTLADPINGKWLKHYYS